MPNDPVADYLELDAERCLAEDADDGRSAEHLETLMRDLRENVFTQEHHDRLQKIQESQHGTQHTA